MQSKEFSLKEWAFADRLHFDRTEVFSKLIEPKVDEIIQLCHQHGIPVVAMFGLEQDDEGDGVQFLQSLPDDPGMISVPIMKMAVVGNRMDEPLEKIELLGSLRAMKPKPETH